MRWWLMDMTNWSNLMRAGWDFYWFRKGWLKNAAVMARVERQNGRGRVPSGDTHGPSYEVLETTQAVEKEGRRLLRTSSDGRLHVAIRRDQWEYAPHCTWRSHFLMGHRLVRDRGYPEAHRYAAYNDFFVNRKPWKRHTIAAATHFAREINVELHMVSNDYY